MRPRRARPIRPIAMHLAVAAAMTAPAASPDRAAGAGAKSVRPAKICGACHGPIYRDWERSSMAHAWSGPVFQAFLAEAKRTRGDAIQATCVACHAPLAAVKDDPTLAQPISREGVTCNFCHNVSSVEATHRPASYTFDPSDPDLMRGPYADAEPGGAHGFVKSAIHSSGDFCAACHSYADPATDVVIEPTHDDWMRSAARARGAQCQTCHMPPAPGKASPLAKKRRPEVWAHSFWGATTPGALDSAATLTAAMEEGRLKLTVTNARAGHALPGGGSSMRAIALSVAYYDASGARLGSTVVDRYGIFFADSTGAWPVPKWLARSVARANAIPADSARTAWHTPPPKAARAEATLTYHYVLPEYIPVLQARSVDRTGREPVVIARASARLP